MSFAIFKGEKNVKDLAKRLFGLSDKSSPAKVDQATGALLQANPQLKDVSKVPVGSIISVPATAPPLNPAEAAPAAVTNRVAIAGQAQHTLDLLNRRLADIESRVTSDAKALLTLAQSKQTQADVQSSSEMKAQMPILITSLQTVMTSTETSQNLRSQAISGLHASLQTFAQNKS